jgi:hypothetical protein
MSLSDSLVYQAKPSAVSGHKYRQNLPTYNKASFFPGEVMMLNVPCGRRGQYLNQKMSYLKFRVNNTSVRTTAEAGDGKQATITPDYSVSSLIARLEIYHGSNLLEQIHEYGLLHTLWTDITGCSDAHLTTGNVLEGMGTSARVGEGIVVGDSRVYAIPLLSGIIGCMQSKYLPTGDMSAGDLRVEITLANNNDGVTTSLTNTTAGTKTWTVSDVELMLEYVELNSEAARMISAQNSGGYAISFDSFANYASTVSAGKNANILIPARYSSLKTLFTIFRLQSDINKADAKTISARANPVTDAGQWYYSIGGKNVPSTPVKSDTEAYAELAKSVHAFGAVDHTSMIQRSTWIAESGTYVVAADLETLAHKSKLTESGINTLSANTHLIMQFGGANGLAAAVRVDSFAHYDAILLIQNGVCSVQF